MSGALARAVPATKAGPGDSRGGTRVADPAAQQGSPLLATMRGKCPRCGKGALFASVLGLRLSCDVCGLDFTPYDQGDGPAAFSIFIVGSLAVVGIIVVEVLFQAPYWVQAVIWLPIVPLISVGTIRLFKAWLISEQYRRNAEEGRLS